METVLAILTGIGLGASLTMAILRPRKSNMQWPPLVHHQEPIFAPRDEDSLGSKIDEEDHSSVENNSPYPEVVNRSQNSSPVDEDSEDFQSITESLVLPTERQRRVLFVIAHPDDECMFFGPTILHFTQKEKAMVFLICLTNGSHESKDIGKKRQEELWSSCELLGIPSGNITLYRCAHMPDDPTQSWPVVNTANLINKHIHTLQCDMVVTFDRHGVSGHVNHRSLYSSLLYLSNSHLLPKGCFAYTLDSVNILRKYSSILDYTTSLMFSSNTVTASSEQYHLIKAAMKAHKTQYVWFRKLYMLFSRYVVMNTLTPLIAPVKKESEW